MTEVTQRPNHDTINFMLVKKIKSLSEERQLVLLKQLLKGEIVSTLFKLVGELSEEQQTHLLEQLQETSDKVISLEETEIALRGHKRRSCMLNLTFTVEDKNLDGFMLDISPAGAFIETSEAFTTGQKIRLSFVLPNLLQQLNIAGEILWKGMLGIGVKFNDLSPDQITAIESFIEEES